MITVLTVVAVGLLVVGFPLWLDFLIASMVAIFFFTDIPMDVVASTLFGALDNMVLLAVPGFIFAGTIMGRSGMTLRLVQWVRSIVGPVPGGIPLTTVAAGEMFGAISGSSAASAAALGRILYPALLEDGYSDKFSLGLVSSSGAIAIIIPPSISMILYCSVTAAPVGKLFLAGFLPGMLLGILAGCYSIYISYREGLARGRTWKKREILDSTKSASWTLGLPVIIFAGIYGGFATPTEAAFLASAYALFIAGLIHRELDWRGLWEVTLESAKLTGSIFLICAAAGLFSWILTVNQVPQALVSFISEMRLPSWAILLLINLLLLVAGMFIDPTSAMLVFAPILWPVAQAIGLDVLHFGIVMVVNMAIGMFSPPFGLNIFIMCAMFRVSADRIAVSVLPFFFIYLMGLLVISYVPVLSLWLPSLLQ